MEYVYFFFKVVLVSWLASEIIYWIFAIFYWKIFGINELIHELEDTTSERKSLETIIGGENDESC